MKSGCLKQAVCVLASSNKIVYDWVAFHPEEVLDALIFWVYDGQEKVETAGTEKLAYVNSFEFIDITDDCELRFGANFSANCYHEYCIPVDVFLDGENATASQLEFRDQLMKSWAEEEERRVYLRKQRSN